MLTTRIRGLSAFLLAGVLLLFGGQAYAAVCGDDVGGRDIPCACGDIIGSSVVLTNDPVTSTRCLHNALIVSVPRNLTGIEIDLNGKTLRGSGKGAGLWITSGGADGVRIVSNSTPAVIEGFNDGIAARRKGSVSAIDNIIVSSNLRDGIRVFGDGVQIRGSEAYNSGRDGFSVRGDGWILKDLHAFNSHRYGVLANGEFGTIGVRRAGITAESSGAGGINFMGIGHRVTDCVVIGGRRDGIKATGTYHEISGCLAVDNDGIGIDTAAGLTSLQDNRAEDNGHDGILASGHDMKDAGGNIGLGNGKIESVVPAKQCEIGGAPCR